MKYVLFESTGGLGKTIMASAVIAAIKKQHPDREILVLTGHPYALLNNPNVYRVIPFGTANVYEDYVKGKDVIFMCNEAYKSHGYLAQDRHLIQCWCECNGVTYSNELPTLHLSPLEIANARQELSALSNKPILMMHVTGGANAAVKYTWNRDFPPQQAQRIADILKDKFHICQIVGKDQPKLNNISAHITAPNIRQLFALLTCAKSRLLIDSFAQHAAAALKLPSTVAWITNKPIVFGYDIHRNVFPSATLIPNRTFEYGLSEYDFGGMRTHDFPFQSLDLFNLDEVIQTLVSV